MMIEKEYKGIKFKLRTEKTDEGTYQEVICRNGYSKNFMIGKNDKFLDIGSHIGLFCIYCLGNGAQVVGFEPEKNNYKLALQNVGGLCIINNKAVVGNNDKLRMFYINDKKGSGMHSFFRTHRKIKYEVLCINVNNILEGFNGLKIDTEGAELEIIRAIDNFKGIKKIAIEYHFNIIGTDGYWEIIKKLQTHGFIVFYKKEIKKNWTAIITATKE